MNQDEREILVDSIVLCTLCMGTFLEFIAITVVLDRSEIDFSLLASIPFFMFLIWQLYQQLEEEKLNIK